MKQESQKVAGHAACRPYTYSDIAMKRWLRDFIVLWNQGISWLTKTLICQVIVHLLLQVLPTTLIAILRKDIASARWPGPTSSQRKGIVGVMEKRNHRNQSRIPTPMTLIPSQQSHTPPLVPVMTKRELVVKMRYVFNTSAYDWFIFCDSARFLLTLRLPSQTVSLSIEISTWKLISRFKRLKRTQRTPWSHPSISLTLTTMSSPWFPIHRPVRHRTLPPLTLAIVNTTLCRTSVTLP